MRQQGGGASRKQSVKSKVMAAKTEEQVDRILQENSGKIHGNSKASYKSLWRSARGISRGYDNSKSKLGKSRPELREIVKSIPSQAIIHSTKQGEQKIGIRMSKLTQDVRNRVVQLMRAKDKKRKQTRQEKIQTLRQEIKQLERECVAWDYDEYFHQNLKTKQEELQNLLKQKQQQKPSHLIGVGGLRENIEQYLKKPQVRSLSQVNKNLNYTTQTTKHQKETLIAKMMDPMIKFVSHIILEKERHNQTFDFCLKFEQVEGSPFMHLLYINLDSRSGHRKNKRSVNSIAFAQFPKDTRRGEQDSDDNSQSQQQQQQRLPKYMCNRIPESSLIYAEKDADLLLLKILMSYKMRYSTILSGRFGEHLKESFWGMPKSTDEERRISPKLKTLFDFVIEWRNDLLKYSLNKNGIAFLQKLSEHNLKPWDNDANPWPTQAAQNYMLEKFGLQKQDLY